MIKVYALRDIIVFVMCNVLLIDYDTSLFEEKVGMAAKKLPNKISSHGKLIRHHLSGHCLT